jgi:hypothetical protein
MKCLLCEDNGWVCENHPERAWEGEHAYGCGGAGTPCPVCNPSDENSPPELPEGFEAILTKDDDQDCERS